MIGGSLDPRESKENPVCTKLSEEKNEATADRKASLIKDAVRVGMMLLNSQKTNFIHRFVLKHMMTFANKANATMYFTAESNYK